MKRLLSLLFAGLSFAANGQTAAPQWTDYGWREQNYPSSVWYTGFAQDRLGQSSDAASALKILEREAQNRLAESIIVHIDGNSQVDNSSQRVQSGGTSREVMQTDYRQVVSTATSATTVKSEIRSFHNPATGELFAFAAVRRADLAAFYTKQIDVNLSEVEAHIATSQQLAAAGKKINAREKVAEVAQMLGRTASLRNMLVAVNANVGESALQTARDGQLKRLVDQLLIDLEKSTLVYLDTADDVSGIFGDILAQALSESGCSVVASEEGADYALTIATSAVERSNGSGQFGIISAYANVKGSLTNLRTGKRVVDFSILNDPAVYAAGRTHEDAALKAFRLPALREKVMNKILPEIRN